MNFWNPLQCYIANGTVLSIALNGHYLKPEKPDAYSPQQVQSIVQTGGVQTASASAARTALISYQQGQRTVRAAGSGSCQCRAAGKTKYHYHCLDRHCQL